MTKHKKDFLVLALLLTVLAVHYAEILFTSKIIRAPDIIAEAYWWIKNIHDLPFVDLFKLNFSSAGWDLYINSGHTNEGGMVSMQFLIYQRLIFWLFPSPANVAWFIVLHLFFGAVGLYFFCRTIGASRIASFAAGLVFALAPENASLINAGHVMKIATISYAPWCFYLFEKGFQTRRIIWLLSTGLFLALQFFNTHWQVAYYTCLGIGVYGVLRSVGIVLEKERERKEEVIRLVGVNAVLVFFFLSTVAISLLPLANWSADTNRGVQSGENAGRGGLAYEEAMSWSMPPEELATFVVPGLFGLSRQEGGENPTDIPAYYWGRMVFTQTSDYMGLLPWLLLPLPLIFRRDRYTWIGVFLLAGGLLFSMGKYTPFYRLLYEYFPGINHFRVPKMMMFLPVMALGLLAARGIDLLLNENVRNTKKFRKYLYSVAALPVALFLAFIIEKLASDYFTQVFYDVLIRPTRFEEGPFLVVSRWKNLETETLIAAMVAALYAATFLTILKKRIKPTLVVIVLVTLYFADVWRINDKFMFTINPPEASRAVKSDLTSFISAAGNQYRTLPMDGSDPMYYASNKIPVMFTSNAVQQRRWQEFLNNFSFVSSMPDMLNVKYLVYGAKQYERDQPALGDKYRLVFTDPKTGQLVLENKNVLPKAWLVPSALLVSETRDRLSIVQNPLFDPRRVALVETPPSLPLLAPSQNGPLAAGDVRVVNYEGDRIHVEVHAEANSMLVLGEKYNKGWKAVVDGEQTAVHPVNNVLRGVYLPPGEHKIEYIFDPLPFKIGKYLTLFSFSFFLVMLAREWSLRRKRS